MDSVSRTTRAISVIAGATVSDLCVYQPGRVYSLQRYRYSSAERRPGVVEGWITRSVERQARCALQPMPIRLAGVLGDADRAAPLKTYCTFGNGH